MWSKSSAWRELSAIEFALSSFVSVLNDSYVKWFTDNQAAAKVVGVGSMRQDLQLIALKIFNICTQHKIHLQIQWVPRAQMEKADFISRMIDLDDWKITSSLFESIESLWRPHSIDCFANHYNYKINRFISRFWTPGCCGIDFFTQNLKDENCLLVPVISLVSRTINYMELQKAAGTLIVPFWPSSSFWPPLMGKCSQYAFDYRPPFGQIVFGRNL